VRHYQIWKPSTIGAVNPSTYLVTAWVEDLPPGCFGYLLYNALPYRF
jgi:hypothetical protein